MAERTSKRKAGLVPGAGLPDQNRKQEMAEQRLVDSGLYTELLDKAGKKAHRSMTNAEAAAAVQAEEAAAAADAGAAAVDEDVVEDDPMGDHDGQEHEQPVSARARGRQPLAFLAGAHASVFADCA